MTMWILLIFITLLIFAGYVYWTFRKMKNMPVVADHKKIKLLTDQNFSQQIKKGVILVDFWASWCAPCKMMSPVINEVADSISENKSVGKLNVELYRTVPSKYNIRSIPTMILFKDGKEVNRFIGIRSKEFLLNEMNAL